MAFGGLKVKHLCRSAEPTLYMHLPLALGCVELQKRCIKRKNIYTRRQEAENMTIIKESSFKQEPLAPHSETVIADWIDYNGHMNVAFYVLIFDHATDALLEAVGMDADNRNATGSSVFVVESHVTYDREVMEGEEVTVHTSVVGFVGKRLHVFHEMLKPNGETAATNELMILHVDLGTRKTAPFPEPAAAKLTCLEQAAHGVALQDKIGRQIQAIATP